MVFNPLKQTIQKPIFPIGLLIGLNLIVALMIFQDYGFSIDEPLFYGYAEAIGYAYSPVEWFSGDFDLINAYGPSPGDHANRGPAYLLIARTPARILQNLGLDLPSSWHLVNFLTFQVGLYVFYIFCLRWMKPWAALGATAFLSTQPVLWEHAFINPKDPPFLVFFLITLETGFRMAEKLANPQDGQTKLKPLTIILLPAVFLGITTNIRVLGPLAGMLAVIYYLSMRSYSKIWWYLPYGLIAYAVMVLSWPFLWEAPFGNFIRIVEFMSYNPTELNVLFYGALYSANNLPLRYLPLMMLITLSEPVWLLASIGFVFALKRISRKDFNTRSFLLTLAWFVLPMVYVLIFQPPMYDGFRHFLFIIPPIFVLIGIFLDGMIDYFQRTWIGIAMILILLLVNILPGISLHPYEYTYYNQFVGGTGNAALRYETDYWATCYKEAVEQLGQISGEPTKLFVKRESYIAAYYAAEHIEVKNYRRKLIQSGDYELLGSRANPGLQRLAHVYPHLLRIERDGAIFCEVREY